MLYFIASNKRTNAMQVALVLSVIEDITEFNVTMIIIKYIRP